METKFIKAYTTFILIIGIVICAKAGVPVKDVAVLSVDFNDRTPGSFIGAGGAAAGEPISLGSLTAEIIEDTPGENYLLVENDLSSTSARRLRWQFEGNTEVSEGMVEISFEFTPSALDSYSILVRENSTSGSGYLTYFLIGNGNISASDAAGPLVLNDPNYAAGVTQYVRIIYDLDAGTSKMIVNNVTQFSDRLHGVIDSGVGALLVGYSASSSGSSFTLDNIVVTTPAELAIVLDADFEDKTLGQPIGTGGAINGEPVSMANGIYTEIVEFGTENQGLYQETLNAGSAYATVWEFLNDLEVTSGIVAIELDIEFAVRGAYAIGLRENGSSGTTFMNLRFSASGALFIADQNGTTPLAGFSYDANQRYRIRITFDLDNDTYKILMDDVILVDDRENAVTNGRGIGRVIIQTSAGGIVGDAFVIDDFQVGSSFITDDIIFKDGFE